MSVPLSETVVLLPCHSLEDFPTELGEGPAEGLLNAFAVLWHPRLLAETGQLPGWRRADEWVDAKPGQLIIVPQASKDWMNCGWVEQARLQQVTIVESVDDRAALLKACLASIPDVVVDGKVPRDESLAADFMALGVCRLQSELLTRAMRRFPKWDEQQFAQEAVTGAKFWLSGESDTARQHVRRCFEMLCENREQFYPVDCFLFDVCLLSPKTAGPPFLERLSEETPLGVIVSATDLDEIARENPDVIAALKSAVASGRVEILGGEEADSPTALLPLDVAYANFQRGFATIERILGCKPTTWVRRRFGLTAQLPQLLKKFEYQGALHLLLDDGVYPDDEKSLPATAFH